MFSIHDEEQLSIFRLFLVRFIPSLIVLIVSVLFLFTVDQRAHESFLALVGVEISQGIVSQLQHHLWISLFPFILMFLIIMTFVCALLAIARHEQISSDKKQSEQLRKIQMLLDSTREGIYGTDQHGCCTLANKACSDMLGFDTPEQLLGQQMHDIMHHTRADGTPYPEEECNAHKMSETGTIGIIDDEVFWRRNGTSFPVSYSVLPIKDGADTVGMVCSFVDISERILIEEQLRHFQKMEAVGQLSGGVAHDFNNILQIVSNNTRYAMKVVPEDTEAYASLNEIISVIERGATLTRSMLAFSRKQFIRIDTIELNKTINDSLLLGNKLMSREYTIDFHPCSEQLHVMADETLIQQVLFNLLTNARDAMPDGGTITITTKEVLTSELMSIFPKVTEAAAHACIQVIDTGCGISDEIKDKIFDPFFTTKDVGHGTGLGLSMVFGTIQQHGGIITASSKNGIGTIISIYLPLIVGTA